MSVKLASIAPRVTRLAEGIRADADRQRRVLLAEAYRESEEVRGDGDAQARCDLPKAYGQIRSSTVSTGSLRAYRESFANKSDVMVLDPSSDFFHYLEKPSLDTTLT